MTRRAFIAAIAILLLAVLLAVWLALAPADANPPATRPAPDVATAAPMVCATSAASIAGRPEATPTPVCRPMATREP